MYWLAETDPGFPPASLADADGLLAVGGSLTTERLCTAYANGIFPWYNAGEPPCWWCPDPRFVLFPADLKVSKSMQQLLRRNTFTFTINQAFGEVIRACRDVPRYGQQGTWINPEVVTAYETLHAKGIAHSAEVWQDGILAGGLYGIRLGGVFFGESMFSRQSNASKYAFIRYVHQLVKEGTDLIDCQIHSAHLESLGATFIPRNRFLEYLKVLIVS
jgi:leucyl/phenylalanyl-tRNA---protein transferase